MRMNRNEGIFAANTDSAPIAPTTWRGHSHQKRLPPRAASASGMSNRTIHETRSSRHNTPRSTSVSGFRRLDARRIRTAKPMSDNHGADDQNDAPKFSVSP